MGEMVPADAGPPDIVRQAIATLYSAYLLILISFSFAG
jgi:hypothetical protein